MIPVVVSLATALVVGFPLTEGFGLWEGNNNAVAPISGTTSNTATDSSNVPADKCAEASFIWPNHMKKILFNPQVPGAVTITAGDRLLVGGVGMCKREFFFQRGSVRASQVLERVSHGDGQPLVYRATAPGEVTANVIVPACSDNDLGCLGPPFSLGVIHITITPGPISEPPDHTCTSEEIRARAEAAPGTASKMLWSTVRLHATKPCLLDSVATLLVVDRDGDAVRMPANPSSHTIKTALTQDHPLVIQWAWGDPFCGEQDPYSAQITILGNTDAVDKVSSPGCPTDYGGTKKPPAGLRFDKLMKLD